jgi:hypothetical protein
MEEKPFITLLKYAAIGGNILFVFWIFFNAMDEGFRGTLPEKLSGIGLIGLLILNCTLLLLKSNLKSLKNQN